MSINLNRDVFTLAQVQNILDAYRALFPKAEITPTLRNYLGWDRKRPWAWLTTDFHAATPEQLMSLHHEAVAIEERGRASGLEREAKAAPLIKASHRFGVGFSIGFNPWTDNLLWRTFDPRVDRQHLVVVVGHDWYPLGAGKDPESPALDQGLHHEKRYQRPCPEAFFNGSKNDPTVFFTNLYPDFRMPYESKMGKFQLDPNLTYETCVEGLFEVLRILAPKFEKTSVISWGNQTWEHLGHHVTSRPKKVGVKKMAQMAPGVLLDLKGMEYLPMSHPSMPNQVEEHLRKGFANLKLGQPMGGRHLQL